MQDNKTPERPTLTSASRAMTRPAAPKRKTRSLADQADALERRLARVRKQARDEEAARQKRAREAARLLADRQAMAIGRACMRRMAVDPAFQSMIDAMVSRDGKERERSNVAPCRSADL